MSDILVSNGTCYTAAGEKLDGSFIPCGNDAYGHQTCCGAGDNCLADKACFGIHGSGYGSFLTYWAGCTDAEYKDKTCPGKQVDQPWVALTLCDDSDGEWAICSQEGDPSTLQPGSFCSCTDAASATVAFKDANTLQNIASLPRGTDESISYFAGQTPTGSPTAGTESPSSDDDNNDVSSTTKDSETTNGDSMTAGPSPGSTGSTSGSESPSETGFSTLGTTSPSPSTTGDSSGTATPEITPSSSRESAATNSNSASDSGLDNGAKIGIGVGVTAAFILLIAVTTYLFFSIRRRRRSHSSNSDFEHENKHPTVPEADGQARAEVAGQPAPPWSLRSELEGTKVATPSGGLALDTIGTAGRNRTALSELPGSMTFEQNAAAAYETSRPAPQQAIVRNPVETRQPYPDVDQGQIVSPLTPQGAHFPRDPETAAVPLQAPKEYSPWGSAWRSPKQ